MVLKSARVCMLALVLVLSACFRPAGEPIEPTPNTNPPAPTRDTSTLGDTGNDSMDMDADMTEEANPLAETTAGFGALNQLGGTLPPITVIQPTRASAATQPAAFDVNSTALPGGTPTYITPGVPLGPIPRTPTPAGGALTATPSGLVTPTALSGVGSGADACTYIVQPGDSLFRIATSEGVTLEEMRAANPDLVGEAPILQPGQELNVPNCGEAAAPAAEQNVAAPEPTTGVVAPPGSEVYTVRSGDTLMTIAREYGVTIDDIVQANSLTNPDRLDIGQELIIPPAGG